MNLRQFARYQACALRFEGVCNGDRATTVLAHLRVASVAGEGQKPPDLCAIHSCSDCHDVLDGRERRPDWLPDYIFWKAVTDGLVRTLDRVEAALKERKVHV